MKTYKVHVNGNALRIIKVRASSAGEALDTAQDRIKNVSGPWVIDFPGSADEHFDVWLGDTRLGPDSQGDFTDDDDVTTA